jgi:tetratricopeptide (TPR) repeat protein
MHRAEVLWVNGRLPEAVGEIQATIELLEVSAPWARLRAWALLGDIQLARGALAEARAAFLHAAELGWDSSFSLALVRFQEGDRSGALRQLTRNLDAGGFACRSRRGQALAHLSIIASAAGELEQARTALDELERDGELASAPALAALALRARGELLAIEGDRAGAIRLLRAALRSYQALGAPVPCGELHRALAQVLIADADLEAAAVELRAALSSFRQAGADGQLATCQALLEHLQQRKP